MNKVIIIHYDEDLEGILQFKFLSRALWDDHVTYTRDANISIMGSLEDTSAIVDRLMKNQEDIGGMIEPYYGTDAASKLTGLLKDHVGLIGKYLQAVKDATSTDDLKVSLLANAGLIADCLDSLDGENWSKDTVLSILTDHLACTYLQAESRFNKDWVADIAAFDDCRAKIYTLADAMSTGIVACYPEKFIIQTSPIWVKTAGK